MKQYKITKEQKEKLIGKKYNDGMYFNPVQDVNGEWFISIEEKENNTNWRYDEILEGLKLAEYVAPKLEEFFK